MANDQFNVSIRITGTNEQEIRNAVASNMQAVQAVQSSPHTAAHIQGMRAAADNAARVAGHNVQYRGSFPAYDPAGEPAGSYSFSVRGRTRQERILDRSIVRTGVANTTDLQSRTRAEAAQVGIDVDDPSQRRWRSAAITAHLTAAHTTPDDPTSVKSGRVARLWAQRQAAEVDTEVKARMLTDQRDGLVSRVGSARVGIDIARASTQVQRVMTEVAALETSLAGATREVLATKIGKRDLQRLATGVRTMEREQDRQERDTARRSESARARAEADAARDRRQTSLMTTAGAVGGMHALSQGVINIAGQVASGNLQQVPGTLLTAGGGWLQRVGAGRMAAARTALAAEEAARGTGGGSGGGLLSGIGGMAGLAGGGMALLGTAVMAIGKVITAGLERGYKNSATADQWMAEAEPAFDRQAREYNVASGDYAGRAFNGARFLDGGAVTPYNPTESAKRYSGIVDRLGDALQREPRYRVRSPGEHKYEAVIAAAGMSEDDAARVRATFKDDEGRTHYSRKALDAGDSKLTKLRNLYRQPDSHDRTVEIAKLKNSMVQSLMDAGDPGIASRENQEDRAENALRRLRPLAALGYGPGEAMRAYRDYRSTRGNALVGMDQGVADMLGAWRAGIPLDMQANAERLTDIIGGVQSGPAIMAHSLTKHAGVIGGVQHNIINAMYGQMSGEEAAGFMPSANAMLNSSDMMLREGMRYSSLPRVRGTVAGLVASNTEPLKDVGRGMIKHLLKVNSFANGRDLYAAQEYEHSTDAMVQLAEVMKRATGDERRIMMGALSPLETKQLDKVMRQMGGTDLTEEPAYNKELSTDPSVVDRIQAMLSPMWELVGKHRNVESIEASSRFTSALDDAANALRSAADIGLTLVNSLTGGSNE